MIRTLRRIALALAALLAALPAGAVFRAYVSSAGSDANPCTLPAPCRLLPAALAAVDDGGEVWMLDSANYNTGNVAISKGVTILAIPGAVGSLVGTGGGSAITVQAGTKTVNLRNLVIVGLGTSQWGVEFLSGSHLDIADCEIANLQAGGLNATAPNGKLTVVRTALRNNGIAASGPGAMVSGSVTAAFADVQFRGNDIGLLASDGAKVAVKDSHFTGNRLYGLMAAGDLANVRLALDNTVLTGSGSINLFARAGLSGVTAHATVQRSVVTGAPIGIDLIQAPGAALTVELSDTLVANNTQSGVLVQSGTPLIYTRGNNAIEFNGTNADVVGGTLTARAGR